MTLLAARQGRGAEPFCQKPPHSFINHSVGIVVVYQKSFYPFDFRIKVSPSVRVVIRPI